MEKCGTAGQATSKCLTPKATYRHSDYVIFNTVHSPTDAHKHEYGTTTETLELLKACHKGIRMNCWETFYIQTFHPHNIIISEQQVNGINPLFELADTHESHYRSPDLVSLWQHKIRMSYRGKFYLFTYSPVYFILFIILLLL